MNRNEWLENEIENNAFWRKIFSYVLIFAIFINMKTIHTNDMEATYFSEFGLYFVLSVQIVTLFLNLRFFYKKDLFENNVQNFKEYIQKYTIKDVILEFTFCIVLLGVSISGIELLDKDSTNLGYEIFKFITSSIGLLTWVMFNESYKRTGSFDLKSFKQSLTH